MRDFNFPNKIALKQNRLSALDGMPERVKNGGRCIVQSAGLWDATLLQNRSQGKVCLVNADARCGDLEKAAGRLCGDAPDFSTRPGRDSNWSFGGETETNSAEIEPMADHAAHGQLEEALDRQMAELNRLEDVPGKEPPWRLPTTDLMIDRTSGRPAPSISVRELRIRLLQVLQAGMTTPDNIYNETGELLLAVGTKITRAFVQRLRERRIARVRLGEDGAFISTNQLRTDLVRSMEAGMTASENIYDEAGSLLLEAGSKITPQFLSLLRERRIIKVRLGTDQPRPLARSVGDAAGALTAEDLQTPRSRALDKRLAGELAKPVIFHSIKGWRRPRLSNDDLRSEAISGLERHETSSTAVADVCAALSAGRKISANGLRQSVTHFVNKSAIDFDLLPLIVAMQQSKDEYLYDHCVNVSLLSLAIAAQLGLDREAFIEIGLGGMLQDIGMLRVPRVIRLSTGTLTDREWREIHRHPLHTLDMLSNLPKIPQTVKFIGYQAHERIDGHGYPRHQTDRQLLAHAKIVSIADVYAAMTNARPYRPPMSPYDAVKTILMDGKANKFDRVIVRALLDTISLFPIGSNIRLSDGSMAKVLRANPDLHTRPMVEELATDGLPTGRVIDLSHEAAPSVVAAL